MEAIIAVLVVTYVLLALLYLVVSTLRNMRQTIRKQQQTLNYYRQNYLHLDGWSISHGSYDYRSFDGGVHWYSVEQSAKGFRITGDADMEHVRELQGMRRLMDYVSKHGQLDLSRPHDSKLLTDTGFNLVREGE